MRDCGGQPASPEPAVSPASQTVQDCEGEVDGWPGEDDGLDVLLQPAEDREEEVSLLALADHLLHQSAAGLIAGELNTRAEHKRTADDSYLLQALDHLVIDHGESFTGREVGGEDDDQSLEEEGAGLRDGEVCEPPHQSHGQGLQALLVSCEEGQTGLERQVNIK